MPSGAALQSKIAGVLKKLNVTVRVVKFRQVNIGGGNALLGVGQATTNIDTVVKPQPVVTLVTAEELASGPSLVQLGDYRIYFDGSIPEETFKTNEILLGTEVLKIVHFEPTPFKGVNALWQVVARTAKP